MLTGKLFFAVLTGALLFAAKAGAIETCSGSLSDLVAYAGSDETDQLLGDSRVSAALKKTLGPELEHLLQNLSVKGSVDLIGCQLVISGNANHKGGEENGIVSIDLYSGVVTAAILSGKGIAVFTGDKSYDALPISIKDWLAVVYTEFYFRLRQPANVKLVSP